MPAVLYDQVVDIAEEYLGPAAKRFISRQITFHLDKKPAELTKSDLPKLVEWVKVSLALLTDDKKVVDDCQTKLNALIG